MNYIQNMVKEICSEKNIDFDIVSKDWIMILKKENKIRYISGYKFDLNDHAAGQICDDKFALYDVLNKFDIPVAEHYIVFKNYNKNEVLKYSKKYNFNVVVKSNVGTCGNDMQYITKKEDLFGAVDKILSKTFSISLSPYYEIKNEYRSIILNNEVLLFYGKKKPSVIGDGKKSIYELLIEFNKYYFKNINDDKLNKILEKDKKYDYNWQFNLSKGAMPFYINDETLKNKVEDLSLKVMKILNLKFASVDVIELNTGELLVLEVNSGVMMENFSSIMENGKIISKDIYEKAIDEMFK